MMEAAFSYFDDLHGLYGEVTATWQDLMTAATRSGLRIVSKPQIRPQQLEPSVAGLIDPKYRWLSASRRAMYVARGEPVDDAIVDFPSYIAATQTQIGGIRWWENERIVTALYRLEPDIQSAAYGLLCGSAHDATKLSKVRWTAYHSVFRGMPLLGFPDLPAWTFENWISALVESPLMGEETDQWTGFTLRQVYDCDPNVPIEKLLERVRDLQIIKPKPFGTLEFRADPAAENPDKMIQLVALRLGQVLLAVQEAELPSALEYREARKRWYRQIAEMDVSEAWRTIDRLRCVLEKRGRKEEKYLESPHNAR